MTKPSSKCISYLYFFNLFLLRHGSKRRITYFIFKYRTYVRWAAVIILKIIVYKLSDFFDTMLLGYKECAYFIGCLLDMTPHVEIQSDTFWNRKEKICSMLDS